MSRLNRRRYGNRRFRFEILEARALLSAAGLSAHPAAGGRATGTDAP